MYRRNQSYEKERVAGGFLLIFGIILGFLAYSEYENNDLVRTKSLIDYKIKPITIFIGLRAESETNVKKLEKYVMDISDPMSHNYGKYLSIEEINKYIKCSDIDRHIIRSWLFDYGIINQTWYADAVKFETSIWSLEKMFKCHFTTIINDSHGQLHPSFDNIIFSMPSRIRRIITVIDSFHLRINIKRREREYKQNVIVDPGMITTEVIRRIYQIPEKIINSTSIGAIEYQGGNGFSNNDLIYCQNANNLPKNQINYSNIIGNNSHPDTESQLDVQMIAQTAPGATLWYEAYPGWIYAWAVDFFNRDEIPYIISISWGWNELEQCSVGLGHCNLTSKTYVSRCNYEFMKLVARGVTICVSSGDAGSPGRTEEACQSTNNQTMNPIFPGSSKWVTSVGATYLIKNNLSFPPITPACQYEMNCANGTEEREVTRTAVYWTSGSGFDHWEQTPSWQYKEVQNYINSGIKMPNQRYWNAYGRAYPDVSAIGHNCAVYNGGYWNAVDGTSCSSPIFSGILAILNDHQINRGRPRIGYANPLLYQMHRDDPTTFHDISYGNSSCTEFSCCGTEYGFIARAGGWDPVSGLGTPNVERMLQWLDSHT